jgi:predicted PurR-regulated permease PerM
MSADESKMYAKGLVDLANISAGALIFGQFASGHAFSVLGLVLGLITTLALYVVAHLFYRVARKREHT